MKVVTSKQVPPLPSSLLLTRTKFILLVFEDSYGNSDYTCGLVETLLKVLKSGRVRAVTCVGKDGNKQSVFHFKLIIAYFCTLLTTVNASIALARVVSDSGIITPFSFSLVLIAFFLLLIYAIV